VVDLPLWKIWVRQLGWWHSQYDGKVIKFHGSSHHWRSYFFDPAATWGSNREFIPTAPKVTLWKAWWKTTVWMPCKTYKSSYLVHIYNIYTLPISQIPCKKKSLLVSRYSHWYQKTKGLKDPSKIDLVYTWVVHHRKTFKVQLPSSPQTGAIFCMSQVAPFGRLCETQVKRLGIQPHLVDASPKSLDLNHEVSVHLRSGMVFTGLKGVQRWVL